MNPFELARAELCSPCSVEEVLARVDALLEEGIVEGERHFRLFGGRAGRAFRMSLGLPLLGGGTPVLRGRVREGPGPATLDVRVGARHEFVAFGAFWALLTVLGGGWQLALQAGRALRGEAGWGAVGEVVPGILVMAGIVFGGIALWRHQQGPGARALLDRLRVHLEASESSSPPLPELPRPIT